MNNSLIDNSGNLTMVSILKECITTPEIDTIRIATGYWDIPGTALVIDELKAFLDREGTKIQLLIGKDPYVYANMLKEPKFLGKQYPNEFIRTNIDDLADNLKDEHKAVLEFLLEYCAEGNRKFEIHIFKTNENDESQFLHSKCYIFTDKDERHSIGIIGSSNFTAKGLQGNAELNQLETDPYLIHNTNDKRIGHIQWFEKKWNESVDWTQEFLEQVLLPSKPVKKIIEYKQKAQEEALTPYELYIKLLQTKFDDLVDKKIGEVVESYLPQQYDAIEYQIDAVKQCISTMKEHGGFMLADVVGLGKTIVGTLVIKYFLQNPDEDGRDRKVLIITPPAIQSSWKKTIELFDKDSTDIISNSIDYITTGSIGHLVDDVDEDVCDSDEPVQFEGFLQNQNYGLILIDESHKFRNSETSMYHSLDDLISQIGTDTGAYPYIALLSATPQNNRPNDIRNQIYLFERNHNESSLKKANGGNIESFFAEIDREYKALLKAKTSPADGDEYVDEETMSMDERQSRLKAISGRIRECVLDDVMVRRTRTDVQKYYNEDLKHLGIVFPTIEGPIGLKYKMSSSLAHLFSDTMNCISPTPYFKFDNSEYLCYYRYRAIQFFADAANKTKYSAKGSLNADKLAEQLARIMQMNLVKRLESSFAAFKQSLQNLRKYTENMIGMWENNTIFICPKFDVNAELDLAAKRAKHGTYTYAMCIEDIRRKIAKLNADGKNDDESNMEYTRDDFNPIYIDLLKLDLELIKSLCDRWGKVTADPKRFEFMRSFENRLMNPETNRPQKLVIFSEAIDTTKDIAEAISEIDEDLAAKTLVVTAANRDELEQTIRENFDANYGKEPGEIQKDNYSVIITTDVLAEGINLHRANCILNYDTPWNSTRLMQRIGRVNRIGSAEPKIFVYNFMPSAEGDAEINLVQKAHTKLQSFHTLFGEDSKVFSEQEEVAHYDLNRQVNGEESPLEKYIYELKQFRDDHPERYAFIKQKNDGLEMAFTTADGKGYFMVRTPKMSGIFVRVESEGADGELLSVFDMLKNCRPSETAINAPLPAGWDAMKKEAERTVVAELASVRLRQGNSKRATEAKEVIIKLKQSQAMSPDSKQLLNAADRLVRQGNPDIIKRILHVGKAVEEHNLLFPYTQEEFDRYIETEIKRIVEHVQLRNGKPEVFIGMYNE